MPPLPPPDTAGTAAGANRETELKLTIPPDRVEGLRNAPELAARASGKAVTRRLEGVYFDTADFRLLRRRVTLRVRRQGKSYIQAIKTAGDPLDGLARGEWEWPVAGPAPDLSAVIGDEPLEHLAGVTGADLRPVFTSHIKRTVFNVTAGDSTIEVAVDGGDIRTPAGASVPVAEVELELKGGRPESLYALALDLAGLVPMRLEPRSKAERGFALAAPGVVGKAGGLSGGVVKAEPLDLTAGTTVEQALCRILRACLRHFFANEAIALAGDDPEGVHQMRVALRRLRSAVGLFRRFLPATLSDWIVDEVRWLGTTLGPARDWDVFLAELLAPVRMALDEADLRALEAIVQTRRDQATGAVRDIIGSPRLTLFQLKLGEALEARDWADQLAEADAARLSQPVESLAGELLARRHRKVRQAGNDFAALSAEERHRLRIALKKLRYTAEFFRSLYDDKAVRRTIQHVSALQDTLGHFNDVATATRLLHSLRDEAQGEAAADTPAVARGAGMVIGWHARGTRDMHDGLAGRWDDFLALKPFWSKGRRTS